MTDDDADSPSQDPLIGKVARTRLYCRKCGYDLTGASENRCPECGNEIDEESFDSVSTRRPDGTLFLAKHMAIRFMNHPWYWLLLFVVPAVLFVVFQLVRKLIIHH